MPTRRGLLLKATPIALMGCYAMLATGCQSSQQGNMGLMNSPCPMKPDCPLPNKPATLAHRGGTVGFCCKGCIEEWNQLTPAQQDARLEKVKSFR